MQLWRDGALWPDALKGGVVAIGNFDGLHRGHHAIITRTCSEAKRLGAPAIMLTFEPHPRHYFQPSSLALRVQPFADKARMLKASGMNGLLALRFNEQLASLSAEDFIQTILIHTLGARRIITGEEFVFGHQRSGNAQLLQQYAQKGCFDYEAIAALGNAGEGKYSSSKIREHLRQGEMALAASLLGRPYSWSRPVVHGAKRGRELGFATANLRPPPVLLPRFGVYAVQCSWGARHSVGVANLGIRPTIDGHASSPLLEVHLLANDIPDLYGQRLSVTFGDYLRGERRFDSLDALKAQIAIDVAQVKSL